MVKINFQGVETNRVYEPIPLGMYECQFVSYKFGKTGPNSKNPGEDKVDLQFAVTGDVPGEEEFKNRRLFRTCTFSAESLWAFKSTMYALGTSVDWEDPEGIDPDAVCREVLNNKCQIKVTIDERDVEDPVTHEVTRKAQNQIQGIVPTDAMKSFIESQQPMLVEPEHTGRRK